VRVLLLFMITRDAMAERHQGLLQRVQQLSLKLAEDLAETALKCEDEDRKARLSGAFHKITRGLRQSVALEAKLVLDEERAQREVEAAARQTLKDEVAARKTQLKVRAERVVWDEYDQGYEDELTEGVELMCRIEDWIEAAAEAEDFLAEPAPVQLARLIAHFRLVGVRPSEPPPPAPQASGGNCDSVPRRPDSS